MNLNEILEDPGISYWLPEGRSQELQEFRELQNGMRRLFAVRRWQFFFRLRSISQSSQSFVARLL